MTARPTMRQFGALFAYPIGNARMRRMAERDVRQAIPKGAKRVTWVRCVPGPEHLPGWRTMGAKWYAP